MADHKVTRFATARKTPAPEITVYRVHVTGRTGALLYTGIFAVEAHAAHVARNVKGWYTIKITPERATESLLQDYANWH